MANKIIGFAHSDSDNLSYIKNQLDAIKIVFPSLEIELSDESNSLVAKHAYYDQPGEIVLFNGKLHLCIKPHTSTNFADQTGNWEDFGDGIDFVGPWVSGTGYGEGALVKYNGIVYRCKFSF